MTRNRDDIVAAAFAAAGPGAKIDPLQAQNLLFLVDRVVSERIGGPFFDFRPYLYGPLDHAVDDAVQNLVAAGFAQTDESGRYPRHSLTDSGRRRGEEALGSFPAPVADYFGRAARWVLLVPCRRALVAIHREYPEMAVKDVARDLRGTRSDRAGNSFVQGMVSAFDLMGVTNRSSDSDDFRSDGDDIRDAWREVGTDIEDAMVRFGEIERLW